MGNFRVDLEIGNLRAARYEAVRAWVDTGATYTWIPKPLLDRLKIEPEEQWPFILADGREVYYHVSWVRVRIGGRSQPTIVVFGEEGTEALLGAFTLEGFGLAADPVNRRLVSVPGLLKAAS